VPSPFHSTEMFPDRGSPWRRTVQDRRARRGCAPAESPRLWWDLVQNGQCLRAEVNAAINSRNQGLNGAGSRRISCVKRAKCPGARGRNANRFQICGYWRPSDCIHRSVSAYGTGCGRFCTSRRNASILVFTDIIHLVLRKTVRQARTSGQTKVVAPSESVDRTACQA
jgi:hypothetical protein